MRRRKSKEAFRNELERKLEEARQGGKEDSLMKMELDILGLQERCRLQRDSRPSKRI